MSVSVRKYAEELRFGELLKFDVKNLKGDLVGGLTSAIVALPLALGFGWHTMAIRAARWRVCTARSSPGSLPRSWEGRRARSPALPAA